MKRKILILSLLIFIISMGCVSASDDSNATDILTLDDNGEDVVGAEFTGNFKELQDLVDNTGYGGTLYLNKDYKGSGYIDTSDPLTIDGMGHTIDGSQKSRIFLSSGDLTLKNIVFKNGNSQEYDGGAIFCGGPLHLINCKFINNGGSTGGAVFCHDTTVVEGCTFKDNVALEAAGAIYAPKLIIKGNCVFENNMAGEYGGSILSGDLEVMDATFKSTGKTDFINFYTSEAKGGQLFLENNIMKGAGPYAIWYEGDDPITSQVNLNFLDKTVKKGQNVEIAKFVDDMGNAIRTDSLIEVQITNNKGKVVDKFMLEYTNGYKYACNLNDGVYTVSAKVPASVAVNAKVKKGTLTVSSSTVQLKASDVTKYYKGSQAYSVTVYNNGKKVSGASVSISLNGKTYTKTTDKNGVAKLNLDLKSGDYKITSSYKGKSLTTKVTVKPTITGKDATGTTKGTKYSVTVLNNAGKPLKNTKVSFAIGSTKYSAKTNDKGVATLTLKLKAGTYKIEATNPKTSEKITNKITVKNPPKVKIEAKDFTKYFGGSEKFTVKITDANGKALANKQVKITINGQTYTRTTDSKGSASMNIGLNSGVYPTTVECGGEKASVKVTVKATISGKDITKMYKNDTQYYAKFVDSKGNPLKNTQVEYNINGVFYKRTTDANGMARMNINLNPGTYIITAKNPKTNELFTNKITVKSTIVENKDLTKYYKSPYRYAVRILGNDGKPVGKGVSVVFNINGVFYTRQTDTNGYARLAINLNPGTYIVTASYNGLMASNTITVKNILFAKDVNMVIWDGSKYEVKLLNGQGKPYVDQTIQIALNGELYKAKTDSDGIVKLKLGVLDDGGQFIITSTYNGLSISNVITVIDDRPHLVPD